MSVNNLVKIDKYDCAIIVIDMQNDFIAMGAPIECPGGRDIIPVLSKLLNFARTKNIPVIYTQEMHRIQKVDFGMELEREEPEHCLEGSIGVQLIDDLSPEPGDYVIPKRRYSAFYCTDLEILLKGLKKNTLIITGAATNVCVYATCLDAQQRDYRVVAVADCVAGTDRDLHKAFLRNIEYVLGDVATAEELQILFA